MTDRTINRSIVRPIVRSIVAPNDLESQVRSIKHDHDLAATDFALAIIHGVVYNFTKIAVILNFHVSSMYDREVPHQMRKGRLWIL